MNSEGARSAQLQAICEASTRRLLAPAEVKCLAKACVAAPPSYMRDDAMNSLVSANNGSILTTSEARAIARVLASASFIDSAHVETAGAGVRDSNMPPPCSHVISSGCGASTCHECGACAFSESIAVGGGAVHNSLAPPAVFKRPETKANDCGCAGKSP